ncbi:hypothetical protein GGI11_003401 [Coemansia sp. RSA 2049]|nr:hypothetical protein GGI11_003401 [Coemansia sp. RSA 2049]
MRTLRSIMATPIVYHKHQYMWHNTHGKRQVPFVFQKPYAATPTEHVVSAFAPYGQVLELDIVRGPGNEPLSYFRCIVELKDSVAIPTSITMQVLTPEKVAEMDLRITSAPQKCPVHSCYITAFCGCSEKGKTLADPATNSSALAPTATDLDRSDDHKVKRRRPGADKPTIQAPQPDPVPKSGSTRFSGVFEYASNPAKNNHSPGKIAETSVRKNADMIPCGEAPGPSKPAGKAAAATDPPPDNRAETTPAASPGPATQSRPEKQEKAPAAHQPRPEKDALPPAAPPRPAEQSRGNPKHNRQPITALALDKQQPPAAPMAPHTPEHHSVSDSDDEMQASEDEMQRGDTANNAITACMQHTDNLGTSPSAPTGEIHHGMEVDTTDSVPITESSRPDRS